MLEEEQEQDKKDKSYIYSAQQGSLPEDKKDHLPTGELRREPQIDLR